MDPFELRRLDFSLDEDHEAIQDAFRAFFVKECPTSVVRAAEPLGYDAQLWSKLLALGVTSMPLPAESGGDGAGIVELSLVAEEFGRALAPVPLVSVAARLERYGHEESCLARTRVGHRQPDGDRGGRPRSA